MAQTLTDALTYHPAAQGGVLALGNFDGVHRGHAAVVAAAATKARELSLSVHALTFEPHPYSFFQKDKKPFRLTSIETKNRLLKEAGAEGVVTLPFSSEMAALSADAFMEKILLEGLAVQHVTVGYDFNFGAGKAGDRAALRHKLEPLGIGVTEVPPLCDGSGQPISSTRIRQALAAGDLPAAKEMLGRPFALEGEVLHGSQRGKNLDFPTANMELGDYARPCYGVYAITACRLGDKVFWPGVANIGIRPTIGDHKELLEFHLFDFSGSLYGDHWSVELHSYMRPEKKFDNLDALKKQIHADGQEAGRILGA